MLNVKIGSGEGYVAIEGTYEYETCDPDFLQSTLQFMLYQLPRESPANVSWTNQFPGGL